MVPHGAEGVVICYQWPVSEAKRPWRALGDEGALAVLLIRHGETPLNAEHRFCGAGSNPPLSALGREQVERLGARLRGELDEVYSSTQLRALETARALARAEVEAFADLRELEQGILEGLRFRDAMAEHQEFFAAWRRDPTAVRVPGGETLGELGDRGAAVIRALGLRHVADRSGERRVIAVVAHQMTQATAICRLTGEPLERWSEFQLGNAEANLLAFDGARWQLRGRTV